MQSGGSAQGTATLTVPSNSESGTDVTLIIEAEAPGSADLNYATVRLIVSAAGGRFSGWYSFSMCLSLFGLFLSLFM